MLGSMARQEPHGQCPPTELTPPPPPKEVGHTLNLNVNMPKRFSHAEIAALEGSGAPCPPGCRSWWEYGAMQDGGAL